MNTRYGLVSLAQHDPCLVETYLSDQSARGNHLRSAKFLVAFTRGAPRRAHYRLELRPKNQPKGPDEEQKELYQSFGWEYVCPYGGYEVWRSYEEEPQELHTDPQLEAQQLDQLTRKVRWAVPLMMGLLLFSFAMFFWGIFGHPRPVDYLVRYGSGSLPLVLLLDLFLALQCLGTYHNNRRLIRRMERGQPRPHYKRVGWTVRWSGVLYLILTVLVLASALVGILQMGRDWEENLSAYTGPLPAISLAQVENNPALLPDEPNPGRNGVDYNSYVAFHTTALAPVQLEVRERGQIPGRTWDDGSGAYRPSLQTKYYELRLPFLAGPLLTDLREYLLELARFTPYTTQELLDTPFDEAWFYTLRYQSQALAARLGGRVILVEYQGDGDLLAQADAIAQALAAFSHPMK